MIYSNAARRKAMNLTDAEVRRLSDLMALEYKGAWLLTETQALDIIEASRGAGADSTASQHPTHPEVPPESVRLSTRRTAPQKRSGWDVDVSDLSPEELEEAESLVVDDWNTPQSVANRRKLDDYVRMMDEHLEEILSNIVADIDDIEPSAEERVTSSTGGQKGSKPGRFDLMPTDALLELAEAYGRGEAKYPTGEDHIPNYMKGYDWSLSFAAMMRHAWAFWNGEDIDPESGVKHIISVAWHALAMASWMNRPDLAHFDTRPSRRVGHVVP